MATGRSYLIIASLVFMGGGLLLILLWVIPFPYKINNYDEPNIQVDFSSFLEMGCKPDRYDRYVCEENTQLHKLGCDTISNNPLLGGLTPEYPIAACTLYTNEFNGDKYAKHRSECVYMDGGFFQTCNRYVVYKHDNFQLLKTMDDFRELFAPVDSPNEALSFALASGNFFASFAQTVNIHYRYSVKVLDDTHVDSTKGGYVVHLFFTPVFGCGPFRTKAVDLKVTYDGNVAEIGRYPVYRDPSEDGICRD